ncbi:MAG: TIR domain-containing protein [Sphaerochaetaceae bacterium]|nr:TIR domain-containing protein [Sphaerochaetaceae bacterium]
MGGGYSGERISYVGGRSGGGFAYAQDMGKSLNDYSEKPRVFLSFHIEDESQINFIRNQAKDGKLEFTDYSVKEPFDEKWKTQCTERIRQSSMLIVMIGPETSQREAVDWEIRKAIELGKPVIGVRIYKDKNHPVPRALKEINAKVICWKLEDIQKEIDKRS